MGLRDPELPAGAIVEVFEDGDAIRNDGVRLMAARKNPWYVLATVAGEQGGEEGVFFDPELHTRNRRYWNGWLSQYLNHAERKVIAVKLQLSPDEVAPLNDEELLILHQRFALAFPVRPSKDTIPRVGTLINFSNNYFSRPLSMPSFHLAGFSDFSTTSFATFADFRSASFEGGADFSKALFCGDAIFMNTYFAQHISFRSSRFARYAFFGSAQFTGIARYDSAHFEGYAGFRNAQFFTDADFPDGSFCGETDFHNANFMNRVPTFYQREMHQDTTFTEDPAYWPIPTPENAQEGKQAYTRLRQIAAGNQNPDLEHFFLRQEMRCKEVLAKGIDRAAFAVYRIFADYGISVARPVVGLGATVAIGWGAIGSFLKMGGAVNPIAEGLGVSIGNTLPFLGLVGKMHPDFHAQAPAWLDALSALQSIAGIILLFFLGLGLRNRFRLK